MYIDTHAHLYSEQFNDDQNDMVQRAIDANVQKMFLPNIDSTTIPAMHQLCEKFPNHCYPMMGLHPCSVKGDYKKELEIVKKQIDEQKYFGVGETGIDLYWDTTFKVEQIEAFKFQINLAKENNLPIIIHSRESLDMTIQIIEESQDGNLRGVFHCFNGSIAQSKKIVDLNFMMGLGGVITFKNANLDEMIKELPCEKIILETDAPYLSPVPYRGKRNESAYIPLVAEKLSEIRNEVVGSIMSYTTENASKLFGIS